MKYKKTIILVVIIIAILAVLPFLPLLYVKAVREIPVDKSRLAMLNICAYQDTPVWPLAKAVIDQDTLEIRRQVLDKHIPVDSREPLYSFNLLMIASAKEKPHSVRTLLSLGADPNVRDTIFNTTPLILATGYHKNAELIKTLLDYGADPNVDTHMTVDYRTLKDLVRQGMPLDNAVLKGSLPIVKLLVEAGVDLNILPNDSMVGSWVNLAVAYGSPDIALYFISLGLDYNVKFEYSNGSESSILSLLRNNIFDLDSEEYKSKMKLVKFLQSKGLDYWKEPIDEQTLKQIKHFHPDDWEEYIKKY